MLPRRVSAMTCAGWIALAKNAHVRMAIAADPILLLYPSLTRQFTGTNLLGWDEAVVGMHIVYAWMPTMLDFELSAAFTRERRTELVRVMNVARSRGSVEPADISLLAEFAGNSVVGASKLLHFLAPAYFPIWDRRVAKAYLGRPISETTSQQVALYLTYQESLVAWSHDPEAQAVAVEIRGLSPDLADASIMRLLELPLFHARSAASEIHHG